MSKGNESALDLSKVVGTIMEHPELIEQISKLVGGGDKQEEEKTGTAEIADSVAEKVEQSTAESASSDISDSGKRTRLLYALKPYLSEKRARAIDSMLTFGEIFDMMKSKKQR